MNEPTIKPLTLNHIEIGHAVAGERGDPVLLLHGWGANIGLMWPLAWRLFLLAYHVYVPDMPGFGDSAPPPVAWSVFDYAKLVLDYLDSQKLDRVHLIGHSFGGRLGLILGADHADRINKLVLIDSAGLRQETPLGGKLRLSAYKAVRDGLANAGMKGTSDRLRGWYADRYGSIDFKNAGALRDTFVKVVNEDLEPYAARVKRPTLLMWGSEDDETPLWMGQRLEKLIPDAGLHVFEGAGHYSYLERAAECARILDYFFKHD